MINIFKMDLFRLRKTRSFYMTLAIMAGITVLFTFIVKDSITTANEAKQSAQAETVTENPQADPSYAANGFLQKTKAPEAPVSPETGENETGFRFTITENQEEVSAVSEDDVTLLVMLYDSASGTMLGLFIAVFSVLFATADMNHGFIKNIGGQVSSRCILIFSKALALLVYVILFFAVYLVVQAVSIRIFFGAVPLGNAKEFGGYLAVQLLLHFALALFCMMIAIVLKNNVMSMIIAVLLCMDIPLLICNIINQLLGKLGLTDFDLSRYSLTRTISTLETAVADSDLSRVLAVGICFAVGSLALNCFIFQKRDIA